jgi:ABC-2 type transport system permease protein
VIGFDPDGDRLGPIPIAAAGERGDSRLVVIGSDHFALNAWLREDVAYSRNRDLILNVIGWLTEREVLMGIRARDREHVKLVLLPEQLKRMTWMCLVGLPGFAIAVGLLVLWRRRR